VGCEIFGGGGTCSVMRNFENDCRYYQCCLVNCLQSAAPSFMPGSCFVVSNVFSNKKKKEMESESEGFLSRVFSHFHFLM